jgi:UDP-N-acetylmuramyl pentapeptide synthase
VTPRLLLRGAEWTLLGLAGLRRRTLSDVVFVAVTGSCGKTTTRDLLAAVVAAAGGRARRYPVHNLPLDLARSVLATRAGDRWCVQEVAASRPGAIEWAVRLVQPRVAVVTNILDDHRSAFRTREGAAEEKGKLLEALPADGVAVLNADDPLVAAMVRRTRARVLTYGLLADADVRAEAVRSAWPERLRFEVVHRGERCEVRTRLCGSHWVGCAVAAVAGGVAAGIPLATAARALEAVEPVPGRMSPAGGPRGSVLVRDDWKAPLPSVTPALEFLRSAGSARRVAVLGTISDYRGPARRAYASTARAALEAADLVVFVGAGAERALRGAAGDPRLSAFTRVEEAAAFLRRELGEGDLVLLKGTSGDGFERLAPALAGAA